MPPKQVKILPKYINTDTSPQKLMVNEAMFIKNYGFDINANGQLNTGTGNGSGEGQNEYTLTPTRSNKKVPKIKLPSKGVNRCIGTFESIVTRESYYFNYNTKGFHGIYVISGDDLTTQQIIVDSKLNFSDDPKAFIAEHRVRLRIKYDENKNILEKYLIWTDGNVWQGFISVIASIKTNGFDPTNIYWKLQPPHFDREELFQYPVRPPMSQPVFELIDNDESVANLSNRLLDTAFQFCTQFVNTDGRSTTCSNLSLPLIVKTNEFLSNPDLIAKRAQLTLAAGSPLTEMVNLYYRYTVVKKDEYGAQFITWSNWFLYDTIYKFTNCGVNSFDIVGNDYWLRKNPFQDNNYDYTYNTFKYIFDNSKLGQIVSQELFTQVQTSMPQASVALSDFGDSIILGNNKYGYNNFNCELLNKLTAIAKNKDVQICSRAIRTVDVYCYFGARESKDYFYANIAYTDGTDTTARFGGISIGFGDNPVVNIDVSVSKTFNLNFSDRKSIIVYAKGTPYYAECKWYQVNNDFGLVEVDTLPDRTIDSDKKFIFDTYNQSGFFVAKATLKLPAGKYNLAVGRHNVATSEDWRNTSSYVMGIANSRVRTPADPNTTPNILMVKPNAITTFSKEMEIDCTLSDIDTWGNGNDLFYIYVPSVNSIGKNWKFCEGYMYDQTGSTRGMELFSYEYINGDGTDDSGVYTDKNGFYFLYSQHNRAPNANVQFTYKANCTYPHTFAVTGGSDSSGYFVLKPVYFSDINGGQIGFGNYVKLNISVKSLDGKVGYSNVGISIKDGATVTTDFNGNATLIIHNGLNTSRVSNIYINASGNFILSIADCGQLPLYQYDESKIACQTSEERIYPFPIDINVNAQTDEQTSLKQNASYLVGIVGADLAGRQTAVNKFAQINVPSYVQTDEVLAYVAKWTASLPLALNKYIDTKDIKYVSFFITKAINYLKYVQWVGDKIEFIDNNGNVTTDPSTATLVRITIDSLLNANINQNFTFLANYQFVQGDKLRIYDDGDGNILDTTTYGSLIDVDIQGSNYNIAAINANLIPPSTNTVLNSSATVGDNPTTLYVKYDSRFAKLKDKTGFWIELYTPSENNDKTPYFQASDWYPVIQGDIAQFAGYGNNAQPVYNFISSGELSYWDTYLLDRNISLTSGSKDFGHPFESPNVTDKWGANLTSGGNANEVDIYAQQKWYITNVIRSDPYSTNSLINGLGTFREKNKHNFDGYWWGGIVLIKAINSYMFVLCENDYFTTDYNYHFAYPNAQGVMVVNLDNGISQPHQKIEYTYGCNYEDTSSILVDDKIITWHDQKNSCYVLSDFIKAEDITQLQEGDRRIGIKSYYSAKTAFIGEWNLKHDTKNRIDIVVGLDMQLNNLHITFRPRRGNTTDIFSFVNNKRNYQLNTQETFIYNLDIHRWTKTVAYTPEAYSKSRGALGNEMYAFAQGYPYYHLNTGNTSFCQFFGIDTERVMTCVLNEDIEIEKVLQSISLDSQDMVMPADLIYGTQPNSYSYIPLNYWVKKGGMWYAPVLRDANSYPPIEKEYHYRNMLMDGKRMYGTYLVVRLIGDPNKLTEYQELNAIYFKYLPILQTAVK